MSERTTGGPKKKETIAEASEKKETAAEAKERLKMEIRFLKFLILQAEYQLDATRFGDLCNDADIVLDIAGISTKTGSPELIDVDVVILDELCSYAGLCCKKIEDKFVIAFQSFCGNFYASENWVELSKNKDEWTLGQWVMPMGINVDTIFKKYSMSTYADVKKFLRECKHLVDCHNRREQQFKQLEAFMSHTKPWGCDLEASSGYTNVIMTLTMKKLDASANNTQKIIVSLLSKCNNARISRIVIDPAGEDELSSEKRRTYSKMFTCFKKLDMVDAVKQLLMSSDSLFVWKDPYNDDSIVEIHGNEEADVDTSFSRLLQKKSNVTKKRQVRGAKSEGVNQNLNGTGEKSLNVEVDDVDTSQVNSSRSKKRKIEARKEAVLNKEKSGASKLTAAATADNCKNSTAKISSQPKISASGKEYILSNEKVPSRTAAESSKNNDKAKFVKSKHRLVNNTLLAGDRKPAEKRKNTDVFESEALESKLKKSRVNGVGSVSTPKGSSVKTLPCSTPITEYIPVLSTITKDNISAIPKVNKMNQGQATDGEPTNTTVNLCQSDADDSTDEDFSKVGNDHEALLKDLQDVKYENNKNVKRKTAPKSAKQKNIGVPLKGKNKVSRK